jgi:sialate O-acetylesterase
MNRSFQKVWMVLIVALALGASVTAQEGERAVLAAAPPEQATPAAKVTVASVFTDNMVLQQGMKIPVWGTAPTGTTVTVAFAGQARKTDTDTAGCWRVQLGSLKASAEPRTLSITVSGSPSGITLTNVLVGEVWIGSGQSNMDWPLCKTESATDTLASASDPLLRLFTVSKNTSDTPLNSVTGAWTTCSSETASNFSAVAYFFGRELRKARGVPVGLIASAWGGTCAEAWTPAETFTATPGLGAIAERYQNERRAWDDAKAEALFQQQMTNYQAAVVKAEQDGRMKPSPPRRAQAPARSLQRPSCLYNAMIAPLQPFAIRGVIWYQGEANNKRAGEYTGLFGGMIKGWRTAWKSEFPFLFVQIAPYKGISPLIREAQLQTWQRVPDTAMIVITDFGNPTNIHPQSKAPVGARLALAARAIAYGERVEYSGPLFKSAKMKDGQAVLRFTHTGHGLVAKDGPLKGFTLAGTNQVFKPAEAVIKGDTIILRNPDMAEPKAVRYGWDNVPDVNLFNQEGLPASPFRTDNWEK